ANKYVDVTTPWVLFKEGKTERLAGVMYTLCEALRVAAILLLPFIPDTARKILNSLGVKEPKDNKTLSYGAQSGYVTTAGDALFPRLDVAAELNALAAINAKSETKEAKEEKPQPKKPEKKEEEKMEENGLITIDEFFHTQLRIAEVTACEKVEKADKLLKLTVKVGEEERTVVSGIAKHYTPEEMVGKKVVLVYNLKPAKLRGIESAGMLLCASAGDKLTLVTPETDIESGAEVC
ncbi:MAG: methionine--tRNA ligase subunit beta, partial [Clostridiales bacterium]|nr:methionine--tRNA ligase subunit beta [Clostridiales bacterium]